MSYAPYVDLLERETPAVVHIHFGIIAQSLPEEVLPETSFVSWHGYDVNTLPAVHGAHLYDDLFANPRVQHTVGSSFVAQTLTEMGAARDRLWRIPMGVDFSHFPFVDRSQRSTETWEILSVGRLHEVKGYDVLLRAFSEVHQSFPEARLTIIGDGPQRNTLENRVRDLALESVVELRGAASTEEVASAMSRADIFAQTGVLAGDGAVESQGLVFIEAQATGLPIVCSDIGGVPESVARNESALLCRPNEVAEVSDALIRLGVDRDKRLAMGKAGRAFVEKTFSLEQMLDAFERLYQK